MLRIPWKLVCWPNSLFLAGTTLLTVTAVPMYLWRYGLGWFQAGLFFLFFVATGLSITLGYHRLFAHRSFKASLPVRWFTLVFGAAAFQNTLLRWTADHRRHHKFVDHDEDPYDITQGFFHAHMGWILFQLKSETSLDYVKDLQEDYWVRWQHRHYYAIALLAGLGLPALIGWLWAGSVGAWGGFLIAGVARLVCVHHMTFFINSLCHTIGNQPYSSQCTARDSALMALFTFGEGYHNFHHAFQHDYRNGARPWQFDPTKWTIWLLHQLGLVRQLRRVPEERIRLARITEQQRQLAARLSAKPVVLAEPIQSRWQAAQEALHQAFQHWEHCEARYRLALEKKLEASRDKLAEIRREFQEARAQVQCAFRHWQETYCLVLDHCAAGP